MVFSSLSFIFVFLPIFLALYYISPANCRNFLLFLGSMVFYSFGEPYYILLIFCSIAVNYLIARGMKRFEGRPLEKTALLILALIYNFGFLIFFKFWISTGVFTR